jgi:hypothetical protein
MNKYRMPQEERTIICEVIVSIILSKKVYTCPIPNGFRDRATDIIARIKEFQDALRRATHHVLTGVAKCINVDGVIFENVLH